MGVELYSPLVYELEENPSPDTYDTREISDICNEIHDAVQGWGTDESKLRKVLGRLGPETRCKVPLRYKDIYGKELKDVIESECGGDFGTALRFLSVGPVEADCLMLKEAARGLGSDEKVMTSIVVGRSNKELQILKRKYQEMYGKDLSRLVDWELSGKVEKLMNMVLEADEEEYDPDVHNDEKLEVDATNLHKLGEEWFGMGDAGILQILVKSPPTYLQRLDIVYHDKYQKTLMQVMEKEFGGDLEFAASFMVGMKLRPYEAVAGLINEACKGFGTRELLLTSALIRYQPILKKVNEAHEELYGKSIEHRVKSETSGEYEDLLTEVVKVGMTTDECRIM